MRIEAPDPSGGGIMTATQTPVLPDHLLSAVFVLAEREHQRESQQADKRLGFRSHDFQLQQIFNNLRSSREYPILDAFVFSDAGPEPYSPILNESVSRLQLSGLIGRENPDYEVVFVRPAAEKFYDEVLSKQLDADAIDQLSKVASQFLHGVRIA
jgi:hypothetical protein